MKATLVREFDDWKGDAALYKVKPPISYHVWVEDDRVELSTDYVVVSAVHAMFSGPETYIFPADESGEPLNMNELDGSFRGGLDHVEALRGAGYRGGLVNIVDLGLVVVLGFAAALVVVEVRKALEDGNRIREYLDDLDRAQHIRACERRQVDAYRGEASKLGLFASQLDEIRSLPERVER